MLRKIKNKLNENFKVESVFMKIFFFNLTVIICITLIFQGIVYWVVDKKYVEKYEQVNIGNMNNIFNSIDRNIIQRVSKIPEHYFSNIDRNKGTNYPIKTDIENNPKAIYNLTERLDEISSNYDFVSSLDIYYPNTGIVVTNFRNIHYIKIKEEIENYLPWLKDYNNSGTVITLMKDNKLNYPKKQRGLTYAIGLPFYGENNIILGIHIDINAIQSYLNNIEGDFVIANGKGNILYQYGKENLSETILELVELVEHQELKENKLHIENEGREIVCAYKYSQSLDLIYLYFTPKEIFYGEYNLFKTMIKMIFITFIVMSFIGGYFISKRSNRAYSKEVALVGNSLDIEESNFDSTIKQISNKIFSLNKQVEIGTQAALSNEMRNIVNGNITKETELIVGQQIIYEYIYGCIIKTKSPIQELDDIGLVNEINLEEEGFRTIFIKNKKNEIVLLINYTQEAYMSTSKWLEYFIKKFNSGNVVIAIGNSYKGEITEIADSLNEAYIALEYHYIWPDKKWFSYPELSKTNFKTTKNHLKLFLQIENGIRSNDYEQVKLKIEQLMIAFETGYYSSYYCKATLRDLVTYIHHLGEGYEIDSTKLYGYDIREYFSDIEDIHQFKDWILDVCGSLMNSIIKNKSEIGGQIEERIISIIEENLENDISLEFLADKISMRPDTLSKLFKTVMGKNYSEYIKEKKLEYAVQLLKSQKYSIKEIAEKLGYNSTQYFIKIFKDEYGETPKQYQKQYGIRG